MCRTSFFHFPEGFHSITEDIKSTINATNLKIFFYVNFYVKYIINTRRCTILSHSAADHETLDIFQAGKSSIAAFNINGLKMSIKKRFVSNMFLSSCCVDNQTSMVVSKLKPVHVSEVFFNSMNMGIRSNFFR